MLVISCSSCVPCKLSYALSNDLVDVSCHNKEPRSKGYKILAVPRFTQCTVMFRILKLGIFQTKSAKEAAVATYSKQSQHLRIHHKKRCRDYWLQQLVRSESYRTKWRRKKVNPLFTLGFVMTALKAVWPLQYWIPPYVGSTSCALRLAFRLHFALHSSRFHDLH